MEIGRQDGVSLVSSTKDQATCNIVANNNQVILYEKDAQEEKQVAVRDVQGLQDQWRMSMDQQRYENL